MDNSVERTTENWERLDATLAEEIAPRAALGLLALAPDRAIAEDFADITRGIEGVATFSTRVPFDSAATPETLPRIEQHLVTATELLVPAAKLDSISFGCTSATVAIGAERVRSAIGRVRSGVPVATPIEAAIEALRLLSCSKISLLTPYIESTADLVLGYFQAHGIEVVRKATFGLDGDPEINRVTQQCIVESGKRLFDPSSHALFISCTGLRTAPLIAALEEAIGKPVLTSNQLLAWQALRLAGVNEFDKRFGSYF